MWRQKLLQSMLKISYYNALFRAVLTSPMDFNTWQLHPSRFYTIFCGVVHIGYLALIPLTYSSYMYKHSYMSNMPVLQCVYTVTNASLIFAVVVYIAVFWMQRTSVFASCKSVEYFRRRYRYKLRCTMPGIMQAKQKFDILMLIKYCSTEVNTWLVLYIFFKMSVNHEIDFLYSAVSCSLLTMFLGTTIDQFCNILTHLLMNFECVNESLHSLILQLKALDNALSQGASEMLVRHRARSLQRHLTELNGMHRHCFQLTQGLLNMWQLSAASITLKIVLTNIITLYHAVLFNNNDLKIDSLTYLNGCLLTLAFYVDTILLIRIIDALLEAGNKAGMLLHECGDLLQLQLCVATKLTQSVSFRVEVKIFFKTFLDKTKLLEQFSLELTCRRLRYSICGLFNLDRQMSLKFLVLAVSQVTMLLQFDLKSKIKVK